jgi:acetylornithine deacetylase/succinyl-diaminopimelate desuccinylase-like protein
MRIRSICLWSPQRVVGTVGRIAVIPNQPNVVPGFVRLEADLRANDQEKTRTVLSELAEKCEGVSKRRAVNITLRPLSSDPVVRLSERLHVVIADICRSLDLDHVSMESWAGHDANLMATVPKTDIIFVPSLNGISHNPHERTEEEHLETGVEVLSQTLVRLGNEADP